MVMTYAKAKGEPPRSVENMKADAARFLRLLRKAYKRLGKELKYIHVMEVGSHGARHHHIVINKIDTDIVQKCWEHGRINVNPLDDSGDYSKLAAYLLKYSSETVGTPDALQTKRWNASRNLIHPEPVRKIITKRAWFRCEAKVPSKYSGRYQVNKNSIEDGVSEDGYGFFRFMILRC